MALAFKRSRMDQAHERTFPNAKEEVIFRTNVSNKNLLKNPFRTAGIPVGPVGVQNRPANRLVDNRGALYAESTSVLRKGITNNNLLHNPYRFKVDPTDEPRTLSMQVIKEINDGTAPQYIRENKGIDEIAFMIVKALPDNGVKLATISMLKSYITGLRLQSVLDQGGQNVTKAFDVLNQLVVVCKNLFKTGTLGIRLPALLLEYSTNIANVFGNTVLQPVSPMLMFSAIQDLASVSSVLSKLFKSQNAVSAPTNVSIDEWARMEAARLQSIREREAKQEIIDNNAPQVKVAGDNQPTGTQGIKDADTIKQEGTGMRRKKKKLSEMMGGAQIDWGTTNPGGQVNPTPNPTPNPNNPVNNLPLQPINVSVNPQPYTNVQKATAAFALFGGIVSAGTATYNGIQAINTYLKKNELEAQREEDRGFKRKQDIRENIDILVNPYYVKNELRDNGWLLKEFERALALTTYGKLVTFNADQADLYTPLFQNRLFPDLSDIEREQDPVLRLNLVKDALLLLQQLDVLPPRQVRDENRDVEEAKYALHNEGLLPPRTPSQASMGSASTRTGSQSSVATGSSTSGRSSAVPSGYSEQSSDRSSYQGSQQSSGSDAFPYGAIGPRPQKARGKKSIKSKKSQKPKKSKNLDAQILALLQA